MKSTVSPRQAARALGVSESSVKRWCDRGEIPTEYTPGGHRRIRLDDLLEFIQQTGRELQSPEQVGLPACSRPGPRATAALAERLKAALLRGDELQARAVVLDAHLAGHRVCRIADEIISPVFRQIGQLWECGDAEVYQERHACEIVRRAVYELRELGPKPPSGAPTALGGAVAGDQYALATSLVECVLRQSAWHAQSLGANLPLATLARALESNRPRLFWLSVTHLSEPSWFIEGVNRMHERFGGDTTFVVGGRSISTAIRKQLRFPTVCDNMQQLEVLAADLARGGAEAAADKSASGDEAGGDEAPGDGDS